MTLAELQKKKVYILGSLSGNPMAVTNAYRAAEEQLQKYEILKRSSPFDDPDLEDNFRNMDNIEWNRLVRTCIKEVMNCEVIILLPESDSKFCKQVIGAAMCVDMPVVSTDYFRKILETTPQAGPTTVS